MDTVKKLEALLFYKGEPMTHKELGKLLGITIDEVKSGVTELKNRLGGHGLILIEKEDSVELRTHHEVSHLIEALQKDELNKDLGKAGLETLAIILYQGPISRAEIDYIRGVNSNFILRNLTVRGMVEKVTNPDDKRGFLYKPTFDLLSHMGVSSISELPEFDVVKKEIASFKETQEDNTEETE